MHKGPSINCVSAVRYLWMVPNSLQCILVSLSLFVIIMSLFFSLWHLNQTDVHFNSPNFGETLSKWLNFAVLCVTYLNLVSSWLEYVTIIFHNLFTPHFQLFTPNFTPKTLYYDIFVLIVSLQFSLKPCFKHVLSNFTLPLTFNSYFSLNLSFRSFKSKN